MPVGQRQELDQPGGVASLPHLSLERPAVDDQIETGQEPDSDLPHAGDPRRRDGPGARHRTSWITTVVDVYATRPAN